VLTALYAVAAGAAAAAAAAQAHRFVSGRNGKERSDDIIVKNRFCACTATYFK